jgi:hypothetical protein
MSSKVRELVHILLVNTPCPNVQSVCAIGDSSSLANRLKLTQVIERTEFSGALSSTYLSTEKMERNFEIISDKSKVVADSTLPNFAQSH